MSLRKCFIYWVERSENSGVPRGIDPWLQPRITILGPVQHRPGQEQEAMRHSAGVDKGSQYVSAIFWFAYP
ncbi:hypothetical protein NSP42_25430, partial [Salmonella enterica]|nr:hypothetical protein [Salmonella enterica]